MRAAPRPTGSRPAKARRRPAARHRSYAPARSSPAKGGRRDCAWYSGVAHCGRRGHGRCHARRLNQVEKRRAPGRHGRRWPPAPARHDGGEIVVQRGREQVERRRLEAWRRGSGARRRRCGTRAVHGSPRRRSPTFSRLRSTIVAPARSAASAEPSTDALSTTTALVTRGDVSAAPRAAAMVAALLNVTSRTSMPSGMRPPRLDPRCVLPTPTLREDPATAPATT